MHEQQVAPGSQIRTQRFQGGIRKKKRKKVSTRSGEKCWTNLYNELKEGTTHILSPSHIPYSAQHLMTTEIQRLLERSCFYFATKYLPNILQVRKWISPEAGELSKWILILEKHYIELSKHCANIESEASLRSLFAQVNTLRHSAVHRLPFTATEMIGKVQSSARFAAVVGDEDLSLRLTTLYHELETKNNAFELDKTLLYEKYTQKVQEVYQRRNQLEQMEKSALATVIGKHKSNELRVGALFEGCARKMMDVCQIAKDEYRGNEFGPIPTEIHDFDWDESDNEAFYNIAINT